MTPDGRFLYMSERTTSTLAQFDVDAATRQAHLSRKHAHREAAARIRDRCRREVPRGERREIGNDLGPCDRSCDRRAASAAEISDGKRRELGRDRQLRLTRVTSARVARRPRCRRSSRLPVPPARAARFVVAERAGTISSALTLNVCPAESALTISVCSSSMLTPRSARLRDSSRTMPGRSGPDQLEHRRRAGRRRLRAARRSWR